LRAAQSSGFLAVRVGVLRERRNQGNGACVIKSLEDFQQFRIVADGCRNGAKPVALQADIHSRINKDRLARTISCVDIKRRKSARNAAERVKRKRGHRRQLISPTGKQGAAEAFIKEVFSANRQRKHLVRLNRDRIFLCLVRIFLQKLLRFVCDGFGVFARVETVCQTEFDLVGIGFGVGVIETHDLVEIIDAFDQTIGRVRFDHVTKTKSVVFAVKIPRQRDGTNIEFKFAVFTNHVAPDDQTHIVERVRIIGDACSGGCRERDIFEIKGNRNLRMNVETLSERRRNERVVAGLPLIKRDIVNFFAARNAFETGFEREVNVL